MYGAVQLAKLLVVFAGKNGHWTKHLIFYYWFFHLVLAKYLKTVHLPMKNAWTHLRTSWRKPASWLKRPTRNTMRWRLKILLDALLLLFPMFFSLTKIVLCFDWPSHNISIYHTKYRHTNRVMKMIAKIWVKDSNDNHWDIDSMSNNQMLLQWEFN